MNVGSSTALANARIGSTVAGKYQLHRLIGEGGIGAVYAAVHQFTGKHVALKLIDASFAEYEGFGVRFLREARAAADIGHPVICDVLDAGREQDGTLYLALELLEGRTLDDAILADDLRLEEIAEVAIQVLAGMAAAHHRGIVHRDIKPENIFLTWNENGELNVKIIDFGVAKHTTGEPEVFNTQQGAILGTPYYMAPEQAAGAEVDARADLWSVGAVLFHALTGQPPFDEDSYNRLIGKLLHEDPPKLADFKPELPEWIHTAVDGALRRDPADRWQSARSMRDALRRRGKAPIELDWEIHEDRTVRTDSVFPVPERPPATLNQLTDAEAPSVEIDLAFAEEIEPPAVPTHAFDAAGGATIKVDVPPDFFLDRPPEIPAESFSDRPPPRAEERRSSGLWLGVFLGIFFTTIVMLGAGWFAYQLLLP